LTTRALLLTASIALAIVPRVSAIDIDCHAKDLPDSVQQLCRNLAKASDRQMFLLPAAGVSAIYEAAQQRVQSGDSTLAPRVELYEKRWVLADRMRREINDSIEAEIEQLIRARETVTRDNYVRHLSPQLQRKIAVYLRTRDEVEAVWKPEPLSSQPTSSGLQWKETTSDPPPVADLDSALRLLNAQEEDSRRRALRADVYADRAAFERAQLERRVRQDADRVTPAPPARRTPPSIPPPDPRGVLPPPGEAPPPPPLGNEPPPPPGAEPPPPPFPSTPPPPGGPNPNPTPPPPAPAPMSCFANTDMSRLLQALQQMSEASKSGTLDARRVAEVQQMNCDFFRQLKSRCPKDYAEIQQSIQQQAGASVTLEELMCTQWWQDGGGEKQAQAIVEPCDNGGFECREQQARLATICAPVPQNVRNPKIRLFTKFVSESKWEEVAVGHDCRWCRFITAGVEDGKACATFANWSHDQRRAIKITVER
jgi:hypothetical protein